MIFSIKGIIKIKSKNTSVEEITQRINDGLIKCHINVTGSNKGDIKWKAPWWLWNMSIGYLGGKEGFIRANPSPPDEIHIEYNISLMLNFIITCIGLLILLLFTLLGKNISIFILFFIITIVTWYINAFILKLIYKSYLKRFIHDIE